VSDDVRASARRRGGHLGAPSDPSAIVDGSNLRARARRWAYTSSAHPSPACARRSSNLLSYLGKDRQRVDNSGTRTSRCGCRVASIATPMVASCTTSTPSRTSRGASSVAIVSRCGAGTTASRSGDVEAPGVATAASGVESARTAIAWRRALDLHEGISDVAVEGRADPPATGGRAACKRGSRSLAGRGRPPAGSRRARRDHRPARGAVSGRTGLSGSPPSTSSSRPPAPARCS
jgi:hypothetical protein